MKSQAAEGIVGGRYLVDGQLGHGGMARVFDAFDERLHRRVAVKILHPHTESLPGMRQRFQQEARIAARLIHPNIVAVLDYGEDGESCYLVMERLPGRTFRDEIAGGPLPPERVHIVIGETLAALAAAHKYGVLHRDIKPSNILLQEDGTHIKITDFGIAKSFDLEDDPHDDMTQTGIILGTPGYLAPERRLGAPATVQSDVYSVGAVMLEALSGRRPRDGGSALDGLPVGLRQLTATALALDPTERFESAEAMLAALEGATHGTAAESVTAPLPVEPVISTPAIEATSEIGTPTVALAAPPVMPRPGLRRRPPKSAVMAITAAALLLALILLVTTSGNSNGPPASASSHNVRSHTLADPEGRAIRALATSLANGGLPGDHALASALLATAAQPPGAARAAEAERAMVLASVLLSGGGISASQYQDVVSILQPTGAPVPTTTTTTSPPPPTQPAPGPGPGGDHHGHGGKP